MSFKFEKLEVWQLAVGYADAIYRLAEALPTGRGPTDWPRPYRLAEALPTEERYGLWSQVTRAANSVALNIAEGSTGQTDPEQARIVGIAIRSLVETVARLHLIRRRDHVADLDGLRNVYRQAGSSSLNFRRFVKLQAFRASLRSPRVCDHAEAYDASSST